MPTSRWAALEIADFRVLLLIRLFVWLGLQVQAVIVGWQLYQLRPDALLLGLLGLSEAVPAISLAFVSGHIVDVHRPARVLKWTLVCCVANGVLLWTAVAPNGFLGASIDHSWTVDFRIFLLFSAVFVSGATRAFISPCIFSLIPQAVPRELLGTAAAWTSTIFQLAAISGPALGGLAYAAFGPVATFTVPFACEVVALTSLTFLSKRNKEVRNSGQREPFLRSIRAGFEFTFKHRVLLSAMSLDMFSVLFGGAVAVLPFYADQVLHVGSSGLGFLRAAPSIGAMIVVAVITFRPLKVISAKMLLWAVAGFGLSSLLFGVSHNFALSLFFLACTGGFDSVSVVIRNTILQLLTPEQMRGRVSALSGIFVTSSNEIGAFESGLAARVLGLVPSVIFGGLMTLVVVCLTAWLSPEFRRTQLDQHNP